MDYSSDTDLDGPAARRRQGGISFLIALIGTACLVAAWIMSAGDPYGDLAHRVVEVRAPDSERAAAGDSSAAPPAAEDAAARDGPLGLLPDALDVPAGTADPAGATATGTTEAGTTEGEAFRQAIGSLPRAAGSHPAEVDRVAALAPVDSPETSPATREAPAGAVPVGVPVEEFAAPPADAGELQLTRAQRRAVQRRLGMAGHDAGGTDGVFGPNTRAAIAAYQQATGLAPTGEVDKATLNALRTETDAEYVAWAEAQRTASSRSGRAAAAEPAAEAVPVAPGDCARDASGNIVGGGIGCSLRGFSDDLREAFGGGRHGSAGFQPGTNR